MQIQDVIVKLSEALLAAKWDSPLSTIGLLQALYRLLAFGNTDYFVLHGSAAVSTRGSAIAFGDNGVDTRGKTVCAVELAIASGKFIVDEFILLRRQDNHIFANPFRPIHFKGITCKHLREVHGLKLPDQKLASSRDLFETSTDIPLAALVIPVLGAPQGSIVKLQGQEKAGAVRATIYGHLVKLLHPELDRTSILTWSDTDKGINMQKALKEFPVVDFSLPVYRVNLKQPCDVVSLVQNVDL